MRSNEVWSFVVTDEGGIEVFMRVSQIGHGWFGRGLAIVGISLDEMTDPQHLSGRLGCERGDQEVAQLGLGIEHGDNDVGRVTLKLMRVNTLRWFRRRRQ